MYTTELAVSFEDCLFYYHLQTAFLAEQNVLFEIQLSLSTNENYRIYMLKKSFTYLINQFVVTDKAWLQL